MISSLKNFFPPYFFAPSPSCMPNRAQSFFCGGRLVAHPVKCSFYHVQRAHRIHLWAPAPHHHKRWGRSAGVFPSLSLPFCLPIPSQFLFVLSNWEEKNGKAKKNKKQSKTEQKGKQGLQEQWIQSAGCELQQQSWWLENKLCYSVLICIFSKTGPWLHFA